MAAISYLAEVEAHKVQTLQEVHSKEVRLVRASCAPAVADLLFSILATGEPRQMAMMNTSRKEVWGAQMTTGASSLATASPSTRSLKPRHQRITEEVAVNMNSLHLPRHPPCRRWWWWWWLCRCWFRRW